LRSPRRGWGTCGTPWPANAVFYQRVNIQPVEVIWEADAQIQPLKDLDDCLIALCLLPAWATPMRATAPTAASINALAISFAASVARRDEFLAAGVKRQFNLRASTRSTPRRMSLPNSFIVQLSAVGGIRKALARVTWRLNNRVSSERARRLRHPARRLGRPCRRLSSAWEHRGNIGGYNRVN
jgi:hypothetical protein